MSETSAEGLPHTLVAVDLQWNVSNVVFPVLAAVADRLVCESEERLNDTHIALEDILRYGGHRILKSMNR